jgi:Zn-dependent protease/CBS domain-containing protein
MMFGKGLKLFTLFGFEVKVDLSWIIIAGLVTWSLAAGLFPYLYPHLTPETYWTMGGVGALGLFAAIIFHEFCHSLVARHYGMSMKGITLFIFGGVAEMGDEPPNAKTEFLMAAAGPLSSFFIAIVCYVVYVAGLQNHWPVPVNGVLRYLAYINALLAAFNLLPAFPLDGGRILRSILWGAKQNLRWATRVSSSIGSAFGIGLIVLGVFQVITGNFIGGLWMFLIGMFLRSAAQMSYQQLLVRTALEGEPVKRFMSAEVITAPDNITVEELVEDYIYKHHFAMFPVMRGDALAGCITTREVKEVPRDQWRTTTVGSLVNQCSTENTIAPDVDAVKALAKMNQTGNTRLLVLDQDRLVGVVTLKDLLDFFSLKVELEDQV